MTIQNQPRLADFSEWVASADEHASVHLPLLKEAVRALTGESDPCNERRQVLSDKIERWRYQMLNHRSGRLPATERELADALDLAANELAKRPSRGPQNPRGFLVPMEEGEAPNRQTGGLDLAAIERSLHPGIALHELVRQATALTLENFSSPALRSSRDEPPLRSGPVSHASRPIVTRRMTLYAPLYVSNHCINHCLYCAFRFPHEVRREHLNLDAALAQAEILRQRGFRHLLLVAGDFPRLTSIGYLAEIIRVLRERGFSVAVEIAPQSTASYSELVQAGACGVSLYQETYNEQLYAHYHPRGSKAWFDWRLEALSRAAESGMGRLGLGVLLGLSKPTRDVFAMIRHGQYLQERFPDVTLAFSLPRIHEAPDGFEPPFPVDDEMFVRLYCVLRLAFPQVHLVLSTREQVALRNHLAKTCITQMSAGSCTTPGGYGADRTGQSAGEQFPVADRRSPEEVAQWLRHAGFEVCWEP